MLTPAKHLQKKVLRRLSLTSVASLTFVALLLVKLFVRACAHAHATHAHVHTHTPRTRTARAFDAIPSTTRTTTTHTTHATHVWTWLLQLSSVRDRAYMPSPKRMFCPSPSAPHETVRCTCRQLNLRPKPQNPQSHVLFCLSLVWAVCLSSVLGNRGRVRRAPWRFLST